jgi:hypothetical protein
VSESDPLAAPGQDAEVLRREMSAGVSRLRESDQQAPEMTEGEQFVLTFVWLALACLWTGKAK